MLVTHHLLKIQSRMEEICIYYFHNFHIFGVAVLSLKPGMPYTRDRFRQLDDSPNGDPYCVEFDINKPRVYERFNSRNSNIG